jgi:beta-lactamase regulating signal transducer with metallopeptidase domain
MELFELTGGWMLAMGKTILHSLWLGMLILVLLRAILALVPYRHSMLRYGISVSALILLFLSAIATFLLIYEPAGPGQEMGNFLGKMSGMTLNRSISHPAEMNPGSGRLFTGLTYLYLSGVLFMLFRSVRSLVSIRNLQQDGLEPSESWQIRFKNLCRRLDINSGIVFLESKLIQAPQLVTFLKPAVIVPAGMLSNLPVSQIETILLHELYHLKRKDHLINFLQIFIESVLFYHPAVWFVSDQIRSEREHCCDDGVLNTTGNPLAYAKALMHIAEKQHFTRLAPGAVGSGKHQFSSRIKRILNQNTMKTNMRDKVLTLALFATSLVLLLIISSFNAAPSAMKGNMELGQFLGKPFQAIEQPAQDTVPEISPEEAMEAMEAREEALREIEEIDWEAMKAEVEEAREEALREIEEIDWEAMKADVEKAREEALREIEEIDWEAIREEMELAHEEALREIEEIDWEEIRADMKFDMEELKMEIENSMKDINWDEIKEDIERDLEEARIYLDSIKVEMDL